MNINPENINAICNLVLLLGILSCSIAIIFSRDLFNSTIYFCAFSLLMSLLYTTLKAPDVAITEAAIGAGISTILFLATLILVGNKEVSKKYNIYKILISILAMGLLSYFILDLPDFRSSKNLSNNKAAQYYIANTKGDIGAPNLVTAILASYRGYDTLGETFVIFIAGLGVYALLYTPKKAKK